MRKVLGKLSYLLDFKEYWFLTPSIQRMMLIVCLALTPGIIVSSLIFGFGVLLNLLLAISFGLILELGLFYLTGHSLEDFSFDASGAVVAIIFALSLPPSLPWWMLLIGISSAVILGKFIYGGTGNNIFNPAMVGVSVLLVSFPSEMNHWFLNFDAHSGATPLDSLKSHLHLSQMLSEMKDLGIMGHFGASGHEWVNLAFLFGGLFLLYKKIIPWQIPFGVILGLLLIAVLFQMIDNELHPNAIFHLFAGATMLCAFFVATDPVTSPITSSGRIIFGICIGLLIYVIRSWANHPEGVAFAILIMNACVPLLDYYTRPKSPISEK